MIIDAWMIPATEEPLRRWASDPRYVHGFSTTFGTDSVPVRTPEQMVGEMDLAGIDAGILTCMGDSSGPVASPSLVLEICNAYPQRFFGSFCYDPFRAKESIDQFEDLLETGRFVSALALPWAFDLPPDHALWFPLYAFAERRGVPVTIQVGHTAPLFRSSLGRPMLVEDAALAFPSLKIVLGHLGWPWIDEVIALAGKYRNVFVDTSAHSPSKLPAALLEFMGSRLGGTKVLFGTDYPALELDRAVKSAKKLNLNDQDLANYLGGNAMRVFDIDRGRLQ